MDKYELIETDEYASTDATVYGGSAKGLNEQLRRVIRDSFDCVNPDNPNEFAMDKYEVRISVSLVTDSATRRKRSRRNPSVRLPSKIVMMVEE